MLTHCFNIATLRERAKRRLPTPVFDFLDGAAESETTARRNTAAFDDQLLLPRCLVNVASVDTSTTVLGQNVAWPVLCAPTGASRIFHPDGELAVARAAADTGTFYSLATGATYSIEDVAAVNSGPRLFQLYMDQDRELVRELVQRAKLAGYAALCITVDTPAVGKRERDIRSGFSIPLKLSFASVGSFALHPSWGIAQLRKGRLRLANFSSTSAKQGFAKQTGRMSKGLDPSLAWGDLREVIDLWDGPVALKGIMSPDDARRAADLGATAIIVSNHGGRQLDGAASSIEALPEIVKAVGDQLEIILDGGVRRGTHILKALALGAKACMIGRPYLYGLSAGGEAGVRQALSVLKAELITAMTLAGCPDIKSVDQSIIRRSP